ncbi:MAG TPA: 3-deoxy-7-phosphoheptulonate synthase [Roseiflexaceae bacterium]|nr:3-deoxy-7-phosphoheptulonate synthase [Roseiflexaceae bacterium]HMP40532.1 3-deoxy-7-phosphoheptulonate synthase [Roseiflexaceae bacterium]
MYRVEDLHVRELTPLPAPRAIQQAFPLTDAIAETVYAAREATKRILRREDPRPLVIVGPCSIHDPAAAYAYAERLAALQLEFRERLFIVMRTYFEKPRTTTGWRGLINDPHLDGSFDMAAGLQIARELLLRINALGLPTATEMLDPISPQYISDLVSVTAIGARTTESQTHRALASGLSMPVGFKNSTDGSVQAAINACVSARNAHSFLGITHEGQSAVVKTRGNPDGFVILRGSKGRTNYDAASVAEASAQLAAADHHPAIMVDCSHANSNYEYARQEQVWNDLIEQYRHGRGALIGMMVESNLVEGKQAIATNLDQLRYGVSVTDGCLGWEATERILRQAYAAL